MTEPKSQALALFQTQKLMEKEVYKRIKTSGKELERKRIDLSMLSITVQSNLMRIIDGHEKLILLRRKSREEVDSKKIQEEIADLEQELEMNLHLSNLMALNTCIQGLEFLADALTWREKVQVRINGKLEKGFRRSSISEILVQILTGVLPTPSDDEDEDEEPNSIGDTQEVCMEMLNDIGIALKAFKDKNGVEDPNKHLEPMQSNSPATDKIVEEQEALTELEIEALKKEQK